MKREKEIWASAHIVLRKLSEFYEGNMEDTAQELGLGSPTWYTLPVAYTFHPDPISVARMRVRSPYTAPDFYDDRIRGLAEAGCLTSSSLGGYTLTEFGFEAIRKIMRAAYVAMQDAAVLDDQSMQLLTGAVGRLVQASMIYEPYISKWSIIYSRQLDESAEYDYTSKLDQYLGDLNSYRDDAHLASWRNHMIHGHAWDILTAIWRGGPAKFEGIYEQLSRRGWPEEVTKNAIQDLEQRGWIHRNEAIAITDLGIEVREDAEVLTDRYFYEPWRSVDKKDIEAISDLMAMLAQKLGAD